MQLKSKSEISACEVELEVEVAQNDVARAVDRAYSEFAHATQIPGFRKGKAPRALLERYVPEDQVRERAIEKIVPPALASAVKEAGLEPIAMPEVEILQFEVDTSMLFKASVPLPPKVELGDYVNMEVERLAAVVSDEDVERQIEELRERTATFQAVEGRPVQQGDEVLLRMIDRDVSDETPEYRSVTVGRNLPDFDAGITGMNADEEKVIEFTYPEDFTDEELAGKSAAIVTTVLEIREKLLQEPNNEWAKSTAEKLGYDVESIDHLKSRIREELESSASALADRQVENKIVSTILENSTICYPEIMREQEVEHRLHELSHELERTNSTVEDYLGRVGKTVEQLREDFNNTADRDLKVMLVFSNLMEKENIELADGEVDQEIERLANERNVPVESFRAYVDKTEVQDSIASRLLRRKALDFLVHASNIKNVGQ